jgi:hypothetical protein
MKYPLGYPLSRFIASLGVDISIRVDIFFDEDACVFVATSEDLPGLVLESESKEILIGEINEAIPNLLEMEHTKLKKMPFLDLPEYPAHT